MLSLERGLDFLVSVGPSREQKSIKNQSKKKLNMGSHLGSDFGAILVDFGRQVEVENGLHIYKKQH